MLDPNGYIVTNNHVVEGATQITVTLSDRREFPAKIVGTDPKTDLAIIKIEAKDLPSLKWADYDELQVGDVVLAVGSCDPAGMERLIRGLAELGDAVPEVNPRVVLNRHRPSVASIDEAVAAVDRFAGVSVVGRLPEDRAATDRAWRRGVSLAEAAPRSPLRAATRELARSLLPTRDLTRS